MNIRGISSVPMVTQSLAQGTVRSQSENAPSSDHHSSASTVSVQNSPLQGRQVVTPKRRLQPLKLIPPTNTEPIDLNAGAIETFVHEMDLLIDRMLAPEPVGDESSSLDSLA